MMALAIIGAVVMLFTVSYVMRINLLAHLRQGLEAGWRRGLFSTRIGGRFRTNLARWPAVSTEWPQRCRPLYEGLRPQVECASVRTAAVQNEAQRTAGQHFTRSARSCPEANTAIDELTQGLAGKVRAVMKADAVAVRWAG